MAGTRLLLVILSVVFCLLSLPGSPFPVLAWISLVPLGLAIHGARSHTAAACSFLFGFLGWVASAEGVAVGMSSYTELPFLHAWLVVGAMSLLVALPYGLFGFLYGSLQRLNHPLGPLRIATTLSLVLSVIPGPFPVGPAQGLYAFPMFIQVLDLGGEPLLLFELCLVNWLFVDLVIRIRRRERVIHTGAALLLVFAVITAYGWFRLQQQRHYEHDADRGRQMTIASMQPNTLLPEQSQEGREENALGLLLEMSAQALASHADVDLVVWPETSTGIDCAQVTAEGARLVALATHYKVPFLINCVREGVPGTVRNTALLVSGSRDFRAYYKQRLVPFAEYLPGERQFPRIRRLLPGAATVVPGVESVVFRLHPPFVLAAAICYEILFSDQVRRFVRQGGNVLVNPNNDAWFGDSRVPDFLVASAVYRATEYRIPVIRCSNSSTSLAVSASGEIIPGSTTAKWTRTTKVFSVFIPPQRSPYARIGNSVLYVGMLWWVVDLFRTRRRSGDSQ